MSKSLEIQREGRVLRIAINRPEKRNALSLALCRELADALESSEAGDSTGAVLLEARGNVFCAGMDLDEAQAGDADEHAAVHERLFTFGSRLTVPVVAAVGGPALGGGAGLVANAHIVVAAQGSSYGLTEIRLGMWPFMVHQAVAAAVGERRALELALTGRVFGTQEALAWGLVHEVVPAFELEDRAWQVASSVAAFSRDTVRRGMAFVHEAREFSGPAMIEAAKRARRPVFEGAAFREGVTAFREKRAPKWD